MLNSSLFKKWFESHFLNCCWIIYVFIMFVGHTLHSDACHKQNVGLLWNGNQSTTSMRSSQDRLENKWEVNDKNPLCLLWSQASSIEKSGAWIFQSKSRIEEVWINSRWVSLFSFQKIMKRLIKRYVLKAQVDRENDEVNEGKWIFIIATN